MSGALELGVSFGSQYIYMTEPTPTRDSGGIHSSMRALRVQAPLDYDNVQSYRSESIEEDVQDESGLTLDTNFLAVQPSRLMQLQTVLKGDKDLTLTCITCEAFFNMFSVIEDKTWICEFCGKENHIKKPKPLKKIQNQSLVEYMLQPPKTKKQAPNSFIFCVDISGSMGVTSAITDIDGKQKHVSRLEHMKQAIRTCLSDLLLAQPDARVILITFETNVAIYTGEKPEAALVLDECQMYDEELLVGQARKVKSSKPLAKTHATLLQSLEALQPVGQTALGPALLAALAAANAWTQVVVCTDGLSNVGVGAMHAAELVPQSRRVLDQLATTAIRDGVVFSIVSIVGEECRLQDIGQLAVATGGIVARVDAFSLTGTFRQIVWQSFVGADVIVQLRTNSCLQGYKFGKPMLTDVGMCFEMQSLGCVTETSVTTMQFGPLTQQQEEQLAVPVRRPPSSRKLPFQVQLQYTTPHGARMMRVLTCVREQTTEEGKTFQTADLDLLSMHAAQTTAALMQQDFSSGQRLQDGYTSLVEKIQRTFQIQSTIYEDVQDTLRSLYENASAVRRASSDETADQLFQLRRMGTTYRRKNGTSRKPLGPVYSVAGMNDQVYDVASS
eukprot:m.134429 g.134429  ORF g.134429 m.134429 type:complete len:614 (+) comp15821_c0_seq2:129-1970(+)